jgi:2-C-methyl-D-erythritol 4-phosphate cytidylyltransferase
LVSFFRKKRPFTPTDEASILEFFGEPVYIVKGESANDKLTMPENFAVLGSRIAQK